MATKHWKDFIKEDDTSKKETDDALLLSNLIQAETTEGAKSLDDIAASNINLKALLEEQKNLEEDMHALTGKADTNKNSNRQYDNEIKTISQKRKEEQQDEVRRQKLLEKRKKKAKETDSWLKKKSRKSTKKPSTLSNTNSKQKKQNALQSVTPKHKLKALKPRLNTVAKKAQKPQALINTTKKVISNANTVLKAANGFNFNVEPKAPSTNSKSKKSNEAVKKSDKTIKKVGSFIKKASKTVNTVVKTTDKVSKTYNTFSNALEKIDSISNSKDMPLKDVSKLKQLTNGKKVVKPSLISGDKKPNQLKSIKAPIKTIDTVVNTAKHISKAGKTISNTLNTINTKQNAISNQLNTIKKQSTPFNKRETVKPLEIKPKNTEHTIPLNKAANLFNNANQYLNKTDTATKHFESVFNRIDSINKKAKKDSTAFAMPSVNNIFTKKESQTKGFTINPNTVTTIKKVVEQLPLKKASKPKNNKSFI